MLAGRGRKQKDARTKTQLSASVEAWRVGEWTSGLYSERGVGASPPLQQSGVGEIHGARADASPKRKDRQAQDDALDNAKRT